MNRKYIQAISSGFRWKLLFILVTVLGCQSYSYGQSGNSGNPIDMQALFEKQQVGTPETAALKQNIVYPVNYSTGLPEIKIPLYEVRSGDIVLPIYLTYHASGIKLSDASGWVGLGWNLVAEPVISRTIQGQRDDPKTMTCKFDKDAYWKQGPYYIENLTKVPKEEPDEYYYRLPDKQGMFMYAMEPVDASRTFLPLPYENIRINWTGASFCITDDDGTIYNFGGGKDIGGKELDVIGWKASSIVASNRKDSIAFVYNPWVNRYFSEGYNDYIVVKDNFSWKQTLNVDRMDVPLKCDVPSLPDEWMQDPIIVSRQNNTTSGYQLTDAGEIVSDGSVPDRGTQDRRVYTDSHPLSEIRFSQGTIVFTQDNHYQRLQKITICDCSGAFVREILFDYLTSAYNINNRYFLKSIVITDREGIAQETYSFGYCNPRSLPVPGTRAIDYWGYFNNVFHKADETLVPWQTIDVSRGYFTPEGYYRTTGTTLNIGSRLSREPDEKYMKYGVLDSIAYPTGSVDVFSYEPHRYKTKEGEVRLAGGLRVREIKTIGKEGGMKIRTFEYGTDGCGTPATTNPLDYLYLVQGMYIGDPLTIWFMNGSVFYAPDEGRYITARHRTFFCNPPRTMTFDGGSSVMYNYVTEYDGTPANNFGKTEYHYFIKSTLPLPEDMNIMRCDRYDGWMYGDLLNKTVYRNDGEKYTPLEHMEYYYSVTDKSFGKIFTGEAASRNVIKESVTGKIPDEARLGNDYRRTEITVGAKVLSRSHRKVYAGDHSVNTVTEYEYADPATTYPTCITETGPDGVKHITKLTYPQDYDDAYPYSEMVEHNILSPVVKKEYTRGGQYLGIETPYSSPSANIYQPESAIIRHSASESGDIRVTYLYDDYGRKCQETKDGKENVVYLYGYSNQHVIARIENATYEDIVAKLGGKEAVKRNASAKSPDMYLIDALRQSLPVAQVTSYTYKSLLGVASITGPSGLTTYYEYDDLGRLVKTYIKNGNRLEVIEKNEYHYANE